LIYLNATLLAPALLISDNAANGGSNLNGCTAPSTDGKNDMEYLSAIGGLVILLVAGVGGAVMLYLIWDDLRPVEFSGWPDLLDTAQTRIKSLSPQMMVMAAAVVLAALTVYLVVGSGALQTEQAVNAAMPEATQAAPAVSPIRTVTSTSCATNGCPVSCSPDETLITAYCIGAKSARLSDSLQASNGVLTAKCNSTYSSIVASCARK